MLRNLTDYQMHKRTADRLCGDDAQRVLDQLRFSSRYAYSQPLSEAKQAWALLVEAVREKTGFEIETAEHLVFHLNPASDLLEFLKDDEILKTPILAAISQWQVSFNPEKTRRRGTLPPPP